MNNRTVVTRRAPVGPIDPDDAAVVDRPMPEPAPGQVVFRGRYLRKRLRIQGFVVTDRYSPYPAYREMAVAASRAVRLRYREHLIGGLHNAPQALADLLAGRTAGRVLIDGDPEGRLSSTATRERENRP